jgi:hypothetical protein
VENASGSSVSIPFVNVKYGSALKDNGIRTTIGAIKKNNISPQIILKA